MMRLILPALSLLAAGCAAPDVETMFHDINVSAAPGPEAVRASFAEVMQSSEKSLHISLPTGEDLALAQEILDAYDRGLDVEVITDVDEQETPGIELLVDAGVDVSLADGEIGYFDFAINDDVYWSSDEVFLTNAYVIGDRREFVVSTSAGRLNNGTRILASGRGEDLIDDLWMEHNQIFGGSDSVAVTAFNGIAKSIVDDRWIYPTTTRDVSVELWFGPQERLTKRIVDAVYSARSSVRVLTNDFANEGFAFALERKAEFDFTVEVVVGPNFGSASSTLSNQLRFSPDGVVKRQVDAELVPTIVLIDLEPARDGNRYPSKVFVLSHDIFPAARLYSNREVLNDQLMDSNLWVWNDRSGQSDELQTLVDVWTAHVESSEPL